jgi:murein DD-endopeptidase MepM/ murein hydrolase activator NlpD
VVGIRVTLTAWTVAVIVAASLPVGASAAPMGSAPRTVGLGGGTARLPATGGNPIGPASYRSPVAGQPRVLTGFHAPLTPYGRGHRGVDLRAPSPARVFAAAAAVVSFAGVVAGRGVIVLQHDDGVRTEYEPVSSAVAAGSRVVAGQLIGTVSGPHNGCPSAGCLYWGARRDGMYFDPMTLLQPLGVVLLLPWLAG